MLWKMVAGNPLYPVVFGVIGQVPMFSACGELELVNNKYQNQNLK
jgi:hypothetical protein